MESLTTSFPLHAVMRVLVFIPELYCDPVRVKGEELLSQLVALFLIPFLCQEGDYCLGAREEVVSVSPYTIRGICLGYTFRVSGFMSLATGLGRNENLLSVPQILGLFHFGIGSLLGEWRRCHGYESYDLWVG